MKSTILLFLVIIAMNIPSQSKVTKQAYGKTADGTPVELYTLQDGKITVRIMTYGGIITSLEAPDRNGKPADIVLGFDSLDGYVTTGNKPYMGAIIGRYANRIAGGTFKLDGKTYHVPKNDGDNALHGGTAGFNKKVWTGKEIKDGVELTYVSKNGEEGFPGNLTTIVRYTLSGNELRIEYSATTDAGHRTEPDEPLILQPERSGERRHPRPPDEDQCQPIHAGKRESDSTREIWRRLPELRSIS